MFWLTLLISCTLFVFYSILTRKSWIMPLVYEFHMNYLGFRAVVEDQILKSRNKLKIESRKGFVAIVTGGSRGIGELISKLLVDCDITVIIACRNIKSGENVAKRILHDKNGNLNDIKVYELDLASLKSVRNFAEKVSNDYPEINYLVNNAGIMFGPYKETEDGFESQFGINYLGHFVLTHLLLPNLKKGALKTGITSRIVNVSSVAHEDCDTIHFEDINLKNNYIQTLAYGQSKLAQILFTKYLNKLLKSENIEVFAVHPGIVDTCLFDNTHFKKIIPWMTKLFKSPEQGAIPIVHTCISEKLNGKGGSYISNCRILKSSKLSNDIVLQEKLFNFTNKLLNIEKFGVP